MKGMTARTIEWIEIGHVAPSIQAMNVAAKGGVNRRSSRRCVRQWSVMGAKACPSWAINPSVPGQYATKIRRPAVALCLEPLASRSHAH
jgi:hypothetical protein